MEGLSCFGGCEECGLAGNGVGVDWLSGSIQDMMVIDEYYQ